jgi:hypothetical protein
MITMANRKQFVRTALHDISDTLNELDYTGAQAQWESLLDELQTIDDAEAETESEAED